MDEIRFSKDAIRFKGLTPYQVGVRQSLDRMRAQISRRVRDRTGLSWGVIKKAGDTVGTINLLGKSKEEIEALLTTKD